MATKNFLASREGAAEGGSRGEFRRARAFRRSEAEAVSFVQKRFVQSVKYHRQFFRISGLSAILKIS